MFVVEIHHDYIDFHLRRAQGVRILTVFLYLNDVEEGTISDKIALFILHGGWHLTLISSFSRPGGGTNFPVLDVVRIRR